MSYMNIIAMRAIFALQWKKVYLDSQWAQMMYPSTLKQT